MSAVNIGLAALAFVGVVLAVGMSTTVNLSRSWCKRKTVEADESAYREKWMKGGRKLLNCCWRASKRGR